MNEKKDVEKIELIFEKLSEISAQIERLEAKVQAIIVEQELIFYKVEEIANEI